MQSDDINNCVGCAAEPGDRNHCHWCGEDILFVPGTVDVGKHSFHPACYADWLKMLEARELL